MYYKPSCKKNEKKKIAPTIPYTLDFNNIYAVHIYIQHDKKDDYFAIHAHMFACLTIIIVSIIIFQFVQ